MGIIQTKAFKSGNSVAVRLPKEFGIEAGTSLMIEANGKGVTIQPVVDPDEEKRKLSALVAALRELGPIEVQRREPIEFPDRPGL
ncbi:MAG TPA: AbrB/MazE/SpoVT family DNA-binding domain-containing protein [Sphingomonas sp.]|nr:AbrB/MazE/SpoVT family DNA-binding domain-containing protein [Sphingomonas sp.]